MPTPFPFNRVLLIVLDGAGIGAMPDAPEWGDAGADTFGHILESRPVRLPNLQRYGLGNIRPLESVPPLDHLSGSANGLIRLHSPDQRRPCGDSIQRIAQVVS